jgi:hypothetical protein
MACWLVCRLICGASAAQAWSEFGSAEPDSAPAAAPAGPEIREPFFRFLLGMVTVDSLGTWSGRDVVRYAEAAEQESRFPLDEFVTLSRSRPDSAAATRYEGTLVRAVWRLVFRQPQDHPMPYSILGYHPGSLRIAQEVVLAETVPQDLDLDFMVNRKPVHGTVTEARIFVLEVGYVLLDADGWLDALLGPGLDDSWSLGFVTGRENGRLLALGIGLGRTGRRIYGEFNFADDEVLANGRPLATALSTASRRWLNVADGHLPAAWVMP